MPEARSRRDATGSRAEDGPPSAQPHPPASVAPATTAFTLDRMMSLISLYRGELGRDIAVSTTGNASANHPAASSTSGSL